MERPQSPGAGRPVPAYRGPSATTTPGSPADADVAAKDDFAERPEVYVGAAFAGGLVFAGLLRWLGR